MKYLFYVLFTILEPLQLANLLWSQTLAVNSIPRIPQIYQCIILWGCNTLFLVILGFPFDLFRILFGITSTKCIPFLYHFWPNSTSLQYGEMLAGSNRFMFRCRYIFIDLFSIHFPRYFLPAYFLLFIPFLLIALLLYLYLSNSLFVAQCDGRTHRSPGLKVKCLRPSVKIYLSSPDPGQNQYKSCFLKEKL